MSNITNINEGKEKLGRIKRIAENISVEIAGSDGLDVINALMFSVQEVLMALSPDEKQQAIDMFQVMLKSDI